MDKPYPAYTGDRTIMIPEVQFTTHTDGQSYTPLRGYGYILAVWVDGKCAGWINVERLGYDSVQEFMSKAVR